MAKISNLPDAGGITDDDYLVIVDAPGGTATTKRVVATDAKSYLGAPPIATKNLASTRLNGDGSHAITIGPYFTLATAGALAPGGTYQLGLSWVRGGTPTTAIMQVTTGAASSVVYYVMYELDNTGHPGALAATWGPFDASAIATVTLTGQTTSIATGQYWVGGFFPSTNSGSVAVVGAKPSIVGPMRTGVYTRNAITYMYADSVPRDPMIGNVRSNGIVEPTDMNVPTLYGKL